MPWALVTADTNQGDTATFPGTLPCGDVYLSWWRDYCGSKDQSVRVDAGWIRNAIRSLPHALSSRHNVPVHCNQWGVKGELWADHGRLACACLTRALPID